MIYGITILFAGFFELSITAAMIVLTGLFISKYFKNKMRPRLYIALTTTTWTMAGVFTTIGRFVFLMPYIISDTFLAYQSEVYKPNALLITGLACFSIGNSLLMIFIQNFFEKSKPIMVAYIILNSVGIIGFFWLIGAIDFLVLISEPFASNVFTLIWAYNAICTLFVSIYLSIIAFRTSAKTTNRVIKHGSQLIGLAGIVIIFINIFFVIDEMLTYPLFGGAFSVFYVLAWIFVMVSELFVYLGFILPKWLRKRWE